MKPSLVQWLAQGMARFADRHPLLAAILVLAYVLSPIDLFPEALAGFAGLLDDVLIVVATLLLRRFGARLNRPESPKTQPKDYVDTTAE